MSDPVVPPVPPLPPYVAPGQPAPGYAGPPPSPAGHGAAPAPGYGAAVPPTGHPQAAPYPHPYAAPYVLPVAAPRPAATPAPRSSTPGIVALVAGVVAFLAAPVVAAVAGFNIGIGTGRDVSLLAPGADFDWSFLSPVRDWVLLGEIAFWGGTVLGIWAIVQGIVAIVRNTGRGQAIAAVVLAALGPFAFAVAVQITLATGFAAGASIGG